MVRVNKFVVWAHHVRDHSWTDSSYIRILECDNCVEFWQLMNSLQKELDCLMKNHMLFFMKTVDGEDIMPRWEDSRNKNGGCWSLKFAQNDTSDYFTRLATCFVTNEISKSGCGVNGISIAPKKTHFVMKVWMDQCPLVKKIARGRNEGMGRGRGRGRGSGSGRERGIGRREKGGRSEVRAGERGREIENRRHNGNASNTVGEYRKNENLNNQEHTKQDEWFSNTLAQLIHTADKAVFQIHNNNLKRDHRKRSFFQTNKYRKKNF